MDNLLNSADTPQLPKIGEIVKGNIMEMGKNVIYVDLGPVGVGVIYGYGKFESLSILKKLKIGDPISATVMDLENDDGYVEMSLKQISMEEIWKELERKMDKKEIVKTKVLDANKGGLMISINGVSGFLPASHLSSEHYPRAEDGDKNKILYLLMQLIGKDLEVRIIGLDKKEKKLIVSEKDTKCDEEKERISKLKIGNMIEGTISGIVDFGVFVKFNDGLEGLVHISELAWKLIDDPRELFSVGQKVKCKIIGIDESRISLSIKATEKDPWEKVNEKYSVGQKLIGEVTKINPFGAFVQLDKDIHGLAHISKLTNGENIRNLKVGKTYNFEIISIEAADHRLGLKLCQNEKDIDDDKEKDKDKKHGEEDEKLK